MPYITKAQQAHIDPKRALDDVAPRCDTSGELNWAVTELVICYLYTHGLSYQTINDIVGALDNAKHEFRRRVADNYEDLKIAANGDVYEDVLVDD